MPSELTYKDYKEPIRKGVLEVLLKIYNARGLAMLVTCPLCGGQIGEYTWTFTNFEKGLKPIGISGVQCSNKGCLLHNGIIYESEAKRLAEWQSSGGVNPVIRGLDEEEKDPNRFKQQLVADREKIKNATTMMEFEEASVNPSKGGMTMRFMMKLKSRRPNMAVHATALGRMLLSEINDQGYMISWIDATWPDMILTIIIEKEVEV